MNTANRITMARIALIPLFMLFFTKWPAWLAEVSGIIQFLNNYGSYIAIGIFVLASGTDKLDGYVARKYNQITNLGKLLDPLADKLLISVALIMMVQADMIASWVAVIMISREFVITGLRMIASAQGIALAADKLGKWKMVLQVIAIVAVLLGNYPFQWFTSIQVDNILMLLAVCLTLISGINYLVQNFKILKLNDM
ncbi:CDP-diacylglycerol--glycerol-3-phosphate 3-phosphatidyltransferase [Paenibacillus dokdonensis]|uniref:CDP-diacylglycerol--glycerol-3-phosphate 3-phosphatidyltransferase n=1 Tax=Paenibacillus dokdonensis TaxID=2567944 RepID=A0ABU6GHE5_9BACL|nr:CDP-diacylglycerol--glycerol-3-phosphate 3-phosphatidyltransferase [Paenibacillus dokdonensis]MEC0238542.1 CDP-diacylglycerol--glycerol-3-phosphate 3-phosphatidyltransferase [Paenibacillus dokdonensis]